jgi:hypothetical protein
MARSIGIHSHSAALSGCCPRFPPPLMITMFDQARGGAALSFQRIRHYGLLGNRHRAEHLARCRELLAMPPPIPQPTRNYRARCQQLTGIDPLQCPKCNRGTMVRIAVLPIARPAATPNTS